MENINEPEDEETRIMKFRFEEILHTLKGRKILKGGSSDEAEKRVAKAEIGRANKILEKHLGNTNNICTVIDAVFAIGQTIEERKGLKRNEKRKEKKNKEGPNRMIQKLEKQITELTQILDWTSNQIHRKMGRRTTE